MTNATGRLPLGAALLAAQKEVAQARRALPSLDAGAERQRPGRLLGRRQGAGSNTGQSEPEVPAFHSTI